MSNDNNDNERPPGEDPPEPIRGQIVLDGDPDVEQRPSVRLHALGEGEQILASVEVDDSGDFELDGTMIARARRIVLADRDGDPTDESVTYRIRTDTFLAMLELGPIGIPAAAWARFRRVRRCVDATIRHCLPHPWVMRRIFERIGAAADLPGRVDPHALVAPRLRCAPVCDGHVEVYRRTCCYRPLIVDPPEYEPPHVPWRAIPLPEWLTSSPIPPVERIPPLPAGGAGGPVPIDVLDRVLTNGAIDMEKARAVAPVLRGHIVGSPADVRSEVSVHIEPLHLVETCGDPTRVGSGFVGEDGQIHVCWSEPLRLLGARCRDEYAFVVTQIIDGRSLTIYDGLSAGQWFPAGTAPHLLTFHPAAISCRPQLPRVPVGHPYAVLQLIGDERSHVVRTKPQRSAESVEPPEPDSGLIDPADGPHACAVGGDVDLVYEFSESMRAIGAKYFRVQVAEAAADGSPIRSESSDPDSVAWKTINVPEWEASQEIPRFDQVLLSLRAGVVDSGERDLFFIPFPRAEPLNDRVPRWRGHQVHATIPTSCWNHGTKILVRLQVFDEDGNLLTPVEDGFTYVRWTDEVRHEVVRWGALTHLFHVDNRKVEAEIVGVDGPGDDGDCAFFEGGGDDRVVVRYEAYHPAPGTPSFMWRYNLAITRGISASPVAGRSSGVEAGEGGSPTTLTVPIRRHLPDDLLPDARCAFTATLQVYARIHDGRERLSGLDAGDHAAYAVIRRD